jgi:hypothetical protein
MTVRSLFSGTTILAALTAGSLALAGPAAAIPTEGEPDGTTTCVRIVQLADAGKAGSPLFVTHGRVAVLLPITEC